MFRSFRPLFDASNKLSKSPINLHLQNTDVSSHIKAGGKGMNQFARVRTEYKYPLRSKLADVVHKTFLATLLAGCIFYTTMIVITIPLNTSQNVSMQAKEEKAQRMREAAALDAQTK